MARQVHAPASKRIASPPVRGREGRCGCPSDLHGAVFGPAMVVIRWHVHGDGQAGTAGLAARGLEAVDAHVQSINLSALEYP